MTTRERTRAQPMGRTRTLERGYSGEEFLSRVSATASLTEPALCPGCSVLATLLKPSTQALLAAIEITTLPAMAPSLALQESYCILCSIERNSVIRVQEAHAGHIWFLIGSDADHPPLPQAILNRHLWAVINGMTPKQRAASRRTILDLAASDEFGRLQLPHLVATQEERLWLDGHMRLELGPEAPSLLGVKGFEAAMAQFGVSALLSQQSGLSPRWKDRVRFVPTPEGVEAFRFLLGQIASPTT